MGSPQVPNLYQPLGTQQDSSVFSPHTGNIVRTPFGGSHSVQPTVFLMSPEPANFGLADPVINIAVNTALRGAAENLHDDPSSIYLGGKIKLTDLFLLFSHVTMDDSAGKLPMGSALSLQAFTRVHNAIAEQLLASPRASSFSELCKLCRRLVSKCALVVSAADFELPEHYFAELVVEIAKLIGVNLRDTDVYAYANQESQQQ